MLYYSYILEYSSIHINKPKDNYTNCNGLTKIKNK